MTDPRLDELDNAIHGVIQERHHVQPDPKPPQQARKDARAMKRAVWDFKLNVLGALWRPMTPEDICRMTGLKPEQCAQALAELEGKKAVRRVEGGLWEKVL